MYNGKEHVSLPSRERGLKPAFFSPPDSNDFVAPFAGAWIETYVSVPRSFATIVAPFAGAWIETSDILISISDCCRRSLRGSVD